MRVRWNVGAIQVVGLSFSLGFDGTKLSYASRQFTSMFDFGTLFVADPSTANALLNAAYGAVSPAFETGSFIAVAFTFNIATGFSGSITPTLAVTEATRLNDTTSLTARSPVTPPSVLVIP